MDKISLSLLILLSIFCSCETLSIKKQGMFSAGGSVLHSEGTFNISDYYNSREVQHCMLTTRMYSIKYPKVKQDFQWFSFMAMVSQEWVG